MTGTSNRIAGAIAKAVLKTLATLAVTAALSLLLWRLDPRIGMLVLVVGPVLSMIQSYKHEWPLHWATILLPAFAALASFIVQLVSFPVGQAASFLAPAILFGLLLGSLQGRGHRIHLRGTRSRPSAPGSPSSFGRSVSSPPRPRRSSTSGRSSAYRWPAALSRRPWSSACRSSFSAATARAGVNSSV